MIIEKINNTNDIKKIQKNDLNLLAKEIREFLIDKVSERGGHLASNLGAVELTMAMHLVLDLPNDKIVWDVGHQSYTHKLLTGRKKEFDTLRRYGGMSGFPKRRESPCDCFDTGHSSTSLSAGMGLVQGNAIQGRKDTIVSVIGDGALTGGMAFEALNNASQIKRNFIIVLNDNSMSISKNVGGMSSYLCKLRACEPYNDIKAGVTNTLKKVPILGDDIVNQIKRTKKGIKQFFIPGMLFEEMGLTYLGPVDGHNISDMVNIFREAKKFDHAVIIHVITKKGKGFEPAEKNPEYFHGVGSFDKYSGEVASKKKKPAYTDVFANAMINIGEKNKDIVAITAAMPDGTGLKKFQRCFPDRFFDVGIAEGHAVTFAAGLAASGLKPFVAIYSSFLQRAYDQILHDVCLQNLPVVFAIDRAGLVGSDGETHQGMFDLSYLNTIPNMNIFAPKNMYELADVIKFAAQFNAPLAIRYPRGEAYDGLKEFRAPILFGKSEVIYIEKDIALLAVGSMVKEAVKVREELKKKGFNVSLINARFTKPIDEECIADLIQNHKYIVTLEENVMTGGFGSNVLRFVSSMNYDAKVIQIALPNAYIEHGDVELLKEESKIDSVSIIKKIEDEINNYSEIDK